MAFLLEVLVLAHLKVHLQQRHKRLKKSNEGRRKSWRKQHYVNINPTEVLWRWEFEKKSPHLTLNSRKDNRQQVRYRFQHHQHPPCASMWRRVNCSHWWRIFSVIVNSNNSQFAFLKRFGEPMIWSSVGSTLCSSFLHFCTYLEWSSVASYLNLTWLSNWILTNRTDGQRDKNKIQVVISNYFYLSLSTTTLYWFVVSVSSRLLLLLLPIYCSYCKQLKCIVIIIILLLIINIIYCNLIKQKGGIFSIFNWFSSSFNTIPACTLFGMGLLLMSAFHSLWRTIEIHATNCHLLACVFNALQLVFSLAV